VGPRVGLDRCGKSRPYRDSIQDSLARSSVVIPTEPPGALFPLVIVLYYDWKRGRGNKAPRIQASVNLLLERKLDGLQIRSRDEQSNDTGVSLNPLSKTPKISLY
jgi:hypothetical protein